MNHIHAIPFFCYDNKEVPISVWSALWEATDYLINKLKKRITLVLKKFNAEFRSDQHSRKIT
jgi:hypothetical protein